MKSIKSLLVLMTFSGIVIAIQSCEFRQKQEQNKAWARALIEMVVSYTFLVQPMVGGQ